MKNFAIKLFRRKTSIKNIKIEENNKKTIGVIGASPKMGVTHLSLSIANFLCSALKKKTLYIELCDDSQLLVVVGDRQINFDGHTGFLYKGVTYVLACDVDEAIQLIDSWEGFIVVDFASYSKTNSIVFQRCNTKLLIGSMTSWCSRNVYQISNKLKGDCMKNISYINLKNDKAETVLIKKEFKWNVFVRPIIDNPFRLKESDFEPLIQIIK